jgi:PKD repeat protein
MVQRNSSLDNGYVAGNLSVFPEAKDNKETLYEVKNNAETNLKQTLAYNGKYIIVDDNSTFPDKGLLRIGPPAGKPGAAELIYYETKTNGVFKNLVRGFAGSRQNPWPIGSWVTNAVISEIHNAEKDAVIKIEKDLGTQDNPTAESLNGILKSQEVRFLAPKAIFRATRLDGPPPLKVRFQNFSTGPLVRYLWDFGDGTTSVEKNPIHTYQAEGIYTVQLNVITSLGAQGITNKIDYIEVNEEKRPQFFYVKPLVGFSSESAEPTIFNFVDQTDGDIVQRYWIFDGPGQVSLNGIDWTSIDGTSYAQFDPNLHSIKYKYDKPGTYIPSLLILFENQSLKRAFLREELAVT